MRVSDFSASAELHPGASESELQGLELQLGKPLPGEYKLLLSLSNGIWHKNGLVIYEVEDVFERNETLGVIKYAQAFLAIGDDSGGRSILIPYQGAGAYIVDQGSMDPEDFDQLAASLTDWVDGGCVLP